MDERFSGRKILITGGLGFIGSTLARRLVGLGAEVTVVDTLYPNYGGSMFNLGDAQEHVRVNISDMRNVFALRQMIDGAEIIFNLAGQTSHMDSMHDPTTDLEINCTAQLALLETCRHQNPDARIVFASTRQIYGKPDYLPVDEGHPLRPTDVNGINKLAGESYHLLYGRIYGMGTVALRLTNTYGPRMRVRDARQTFLGVWIRRALEKKPFEVWGGEQLRDFTYVDDVVEAFLLAAARPELEGGVYNLSGEPVVSLMTLAGMLAEQTGASFEVHAFPEDRKRIDIGDYYADDQAFRRLTGWAPQTELREGLRRTLEYYRQHLGQYV